MKKDNAPHIFKQAVLALLLSAVLWSCNDQSKLEKEIAAIDIKLDITRFDRIFARADVSDLPRLKEEYPLFFPARYPDSIWAARLTDSLQHELEAATAKAFPDNEYLEDQLYPLFQHLSHYFSSFEPPKVYTTTSDVDYRNRVIVADSLLVISLDTYLGADHEFYTGIKRYIAKNMRREQLGPEVVEAYAGKFIPPPEGRQFLDIMLYYGKVNYLKELLLPNATGADIMGYTPEEMQWARDNEVDIWRYFIEKEILYSTEPKLMPRFIDPAPFSKFYLAIDNESPGMIGRYIGWQIVRSYAVKSELPLVDILRLPADRLFKESKYKP